LALAACDSPPGDLRSWRPEDHDHTTNPGEGQVVQGPDAGTAPELARFGLDEVTVIAWGQNCVRCHGNFGRGDGPQGPMVHATDLSNPVWQRGVSDEQIALTIQKGRGAMPRFDLPEGTIKALVRLVRLLDAGRAAVKADPSAAPEASVAPAGSAAPGGSVRARPAPSAR